MRLPARASCAFATGLLVCRGVKGDMLRIKGTTRLVLVIADFFGRSMESMKSRAWLALKRSDGLANKHDVTRCLYF